MHIISYDVLKYIAQVVLPAIGTLYFALAQIWDLPYGEQVVGTITAIDAFLEPRSEPRHEPEPQTEPLT